MLANYWGFHSTPFHDPAAGGFFASASIDEALARLHFLVENRHRLGVLLGETGSGKSVLLQRFGQDFHPSAAQVCRMSLLGTDADEFLQQVNTELCLPESNSTAEIWKNIMDQVEVNGYQDIPTVFLFDDAHEAEGEVLTAVARLAQGGCDPHQRLTIIVAADALHAQLIGRRLIDLSTLRVELWPWTQAETNEFMRGEIERAGRTTPAFDVPALDRIFEISAGNPRQLSRLAELALAAGAGQALELIDVETVESVSEELQLAPSSIVT